MIWNVFLWYTNASTREAKMNTSNTSTNVNSAGKSASKSNNVKIQLTHFSKSKITLLHSAATNPFTNQKIKTQRNINWHESEWPDLPKPASISPECDFKSQDNKLLQAGSSSSQQLSKEGHKNLDKTKVTKESCYEKDCLLEEQNTEVSKMETFHNLMQKNFPCTTRDVDDLTCSLAAFKMSNKCPKFSSVTNFEDANLMLHCLENKHSQNQKTGKKAKAISVKNHFDLQLNQEAFFNTKEEEKICRNLSPLSDDDFPDLLTMKTTRKPKKTYSSPIQDIAVKKLAKKYPRRSDPIFINLGEVLESSSSSEKCKNLLRNRYCQGLCPGNSRTDSSRRVVKRGKQREFPKRKPLTKLKLAILRERQQKLNSRLLRNSPNQNSGTLNHCFTDNLKPVPPGSLRRDLSSLDTECQILKYGENVDKFKDCFELCPSQSADCLDVASQSESDKTYNVSLITEEKFKCSKSQSLDPVIECSSNSNHSPDGIMQMAKASLHSRKFREYCNNDKSATLEEKVKTFVKQIYRYQSNSHFRDAEKARIHRRYVLGLREAEKYLKLRKLKVLIIATDLEASSEKGGLDEIIENMKSRGNKENLPVIFALRRRDLAYCVYRKVPVSCMAVLNFEGAEELFRAVIDAWREACAAYDKKLKEASIMSAEQLSDSEEKSSVDPALATPSGPAGTTSSMEGSAKEFPFCSQESEEILTTVRDNTVSTAPMFE